jgi:hypothetical protein
MSRAELAEAVNAHLWDTTGRCCALDAHTVARYERGAVRWPGTAYRSALRAVLGVDSDADLGFRPTRRGEQARPVPPRGHDRPEDTAQEHSDDVALDRRDFLRAGAAGLAVSAPDRPAMRHHDEYVHELMLLQQLDRTDGAAGPLRRTLALLSVMTDELRHRGGSDRADLLPVAARAAEFAGFLHRDLGDDERCLYWHDRAMEWAQQGHDLPMQAYVLLRKAQAAYDHRDARRMIELTSAARRTSHDLGPGLSAELLQQQARGDAMLGAEPLDVLELLDRARSSVGGSPLRSPDEPGAGYTVGLLDLQTAICLVEAGRPAEAVPVYRRVVDEAGAARRDRVYFSILMAVALALSGEPDEAAEWGVQALPSAVSFRSHRSMRELGTLLRALRPWEQRAAVRSLADAVRTSDRSPA